MRIACANYGHYRVFPSDLRHYYHSRNLRLQNISSIYQWRNDLGRVNGRSKSGRRVSFSSEQAFLVSNDFRSLSKIRLQVAIASNHIPLQNFNRPKMVQNYTVGFGKAPVAPKAPSRATNDSFILNQGGTVGHENDSLKGQGIPIQRQMRESRKWTPSNFCV
ncbi:hypothetical protein SUGI_0131560 [Cryptomeria japonica]|nr:hypothetical protein SUGI_0131560 [Cryptomeria japonica]